MYNGVMNINHSSTNIVSLVQKRYVFFLEFDFMCTTNVCCFNNKCPINYVVFTLKFRISTDVQKNYVYFYRAIMNATCVQKNYGAQCVMFIFAV